MTLSEMIRAYQRKHGLDDDGVAGPQTWGHIYRHEVLGEDDAPATPADITTVDARSEKAIQTLLPEVRPYARALLHLAAENEVTLIVTSGTRTYEEQDALYEQGRTRPGPKVTNARGGFSNHNFGIAFDVTVFHGVTPMYESPLYKAAGAWGKSLGLSWGGDWLSFQDEPHFELRPDWAQGMDEKVMLGGLRARKEGGKPIFV